MISFNEHQIFMVEWRPSITLLAVLAASAVSPCPVFIHVHGSIVLIRTRKLLTILL